MTASRLQWAANTLLAALVTAAAGCATSGMSTRVRPATEMSDHAEVGVASYYAREHHGRRTASGQRFDMNGLTAAHPSLPFGTRVRVTNLANGKSVVVTITDRGPFKRGRIIDVSYRAARELEFVRAGLARVRVEIVQS